MNISHNKKPKDNRRNTMANQEKDPMIDMYVHETFQLIEQLEKIIIDSEKSKNVEAAINEIFRIMHTIKGNSMMMKYDNISELAHVTEDLFDYLRTKQPQNINYSNITNVVLDSVDFFKDEVTKIQNEQPSSNKADDLIEVIVDLLESLKFMETPVLEEEKSVENQTKDIKVPPREMLDNFFYVKIDFEDECQMENIRSYSIVHNLDEFGCEIYHFPKDLEDMDEGLDTIKTQGFQLALNSLQNKKELECYFERVSFLEGLEIKEITQQEYESFGVSFNKHISEKDITDEKMPVGNLESPEEKASIEKTEERLNNEKDENTIEDNKKAVVEQAQVKQQKYINVNVEKLDMLMNLVGELVVSEAMVTQNPELKKLSIPSIEKSAAQMRKIINEVQDTVMEIRMVPLAMTFQRMNRIVRDMSVKTNKEVDLVLIGQETEVDKNIIEHIADPLMHLIRNAIDHGLETPEERKKVGKPEKGIVTLEAKNTGGDVWIVVKDDGRGLDRDKIINKADKQGLLKKPIEDYSDKEVYGLIFEAGLSTKEAVTNFSGRGVGMDAVVKELEKIGGIAVVESEKEKGTSVTLRIPLTLAIINGMVMNVGDNKFTLPITTIRESFKAKKKDIVIDTDKNEMILVRGECYSVIRIHERYGLKTDIVDLEEGIMVMLENEDHKACLFVDQLIGEYQVVVKSFSKYIQKIQGISGCAHLGDGGICLILDPPGIIT